jgi:hypothetical protein
MPKSADTLVHKPASDHDQLCPCVLAIGLRVRDSETNLLGLPLTIFHDSLRHQSPRFEVRQLCLSDLVGSFRTWLSSDLSVACVNALHKKASAQRSIKLNQVQIRPSPLVQHHLLIAGEHEDRYTLPTTGQLVSDEPAADLAGGEGDEADVSRAHAGQGRAESSKLPKDKSFLWENELRQEGKKEQSGFRIWKLRHHALPKRPRRVDHAGCAKMKVTRPFKQCAHAEKNQIAAPANFTTSKAGIKSEEVVHFPFGSSQAAKARARSNSSPSNPNRCDDGGSGRRRFP